MRRPRLRAIALTGSAVLASTALLLTACAGDTAPSSSPGSADANASVAIRLVLEPGNLDIRQTAGAALDQILIDNIYQGLVARTPGQDIVPSLASDYSVSTDGLTYTFTVRDGVTFHDGSELTVDDVVWSLREHTDEAWADSARLAQVASIEADGQDVVMTLSEPDSALLWNLTGRAGLIFKKDDTIDYKTAANGTGPFVLDAWKQGDSITFGRYADYWGERAKVAEVVFDYVPDNQAALTGALAGEFDVLTGFDATLKEQIEATGDFAVELGQSTDKWVLAMNSTAGRLADKDVRQAIRQGIDHDALIAAAGAGVPMHGPIPVLDPGYEDLSDVAPYDVEAAKQLLEDAGATGTTLTLTTWSGYGTTIPQLLVSDFDKIGITLTVKQVDFPTWINNVYSNRDYQLSLINHAEARDVENWANPDYYFTYDNPRVQSLFEQSLGALTESEAADYLRQAARIVSEDMAADWLYNWQSVQAIGTGITGFPVDNVNARINLAELSKSSG
ncbi:MAG: ABC transporter substrate-binding protein [Microbacterium sp.]|uniref:ABC transporter substrate-binding protein n=1 Tax=Microbacterium sp. TaxID=51671 RepID=UPI003A884653